ncbi:hypothetical protein ACLIYP_24720 [Streptomyces nanhaiensis]|uniref:hypothetical protein n=1 Tax=Streptomyces nanhaiensis TaxID=679319 RepID=UPI00399C775C
MDETTRITLRPPGGLDERQAGRAGSARRSPGSETVHRPEAERAAGTGREPR